MIDHSWDDTSENTVNEQHIIDKYEEMIRNRQQAGKEIPARPIDPDTVGPDFAKMQVENSQRIMRKAQSKSFHFPQWLGNSYERIFGHA